MKKSIKPEDIINRYTATVSGSISPMTIDGGYIADITIQSSFHTIQECKEWQNKFTQLILENRYKNNEPTIS